MKKLSTGTILLSLLAVCAFNLSSCQEFNIDSQSEYPPKMETDALAEYSVAAAAPRTILFNVSSTTPWKIGSDKEWCTPTPAMSSASGLIAEITVNITPSDNPSKQDLVATLTLTAEGIDTPTVIKITRGTLVVQPADDQIETAGGRVPFTITSNKDWEVVSSHQWLTFDKSAGTGSGDRTTVYAIAENENPGMKRTATVTVSNGLEEKTFEVTQKGITLEFAELSEADRTFTETTAGSSLTFSVNTTFAADKWKVTTDETWFKVTRNEAGNGIVVTTLSEIFFKNRNGIVRLETTDNAAGIDPVELVVIQNRMPDASLVWDNEAQYVIGNEGVTITKGRFGVGDYKLATFEAKLKSVNMTSGAIFFQYYRNETAGQTGPTINCWMGDNEPNGSITDVNDFNLRIRDNWGDTKGANGAINTNKKLDGLTVEKLNAMKTAKLSLIPHPDKENCAIVRIAIDGTVYGEISTNPATDGSDLKNPFTGSGAVNAGNIIYFGFLKNHAGGTIEIESFEVTPIAIPTE